jgi:UDP-N-acetylmuramoyl-L-alanyl-D-glutamate--2,6-diaminopimelate ligase
LFGRFNAYNLLAVLSTLLLLEMPLAEAVERLRQVHPVAGRAERFGGRAGQPLVIVDYAHTPDALEKILTSLREHTRGKLICVFGCGGDRDRGKRPLMGDAALRLADRVIVTSDNPRGEAPDAIIDEVMEGAGAGAERVTDRRRAIALAIESAEPGDVVVIAGKGHEQGQEFENGRKEPFDDVEVAREALRARATAASTGGMT